MSLACIVLAALAFVVGVAGTIVLVSACVMSGNGAEREDWNE